MTGSGPALEELSSGKYLLLTTFRRDGRAVPTPVWVVRDDDSLGVWTVRDSGKVKRIRRRGEVTVAPCDLRGNPRGQALPAVAEILDPDGTARLRELLKKKYGLPARLGLIGSRLRRGVAGTVGIRIRLADGSE